MKKGIINKAIEEAKKSKYYPYKIGAVVFKNSSIISWGHNEIRSSRIHPKHKIWENSLHAEQAALIGLDWEKLNNVSIFVCRLTRSNKFAMARPCDNCMSLLRHIGIKKVYYTVNNDYIEEVKIRKI